MGRPASGHPPDPPRPRLPIIAPTLAQWAAMTEEERLRFLIDVNAAHSEMRADLARAEADKTQAEADKAQAAADKAQAAAAAALADKSQAEVMLLDALRRCIQQLLLVRGIALLPEEQQILIACQDVPTLMCWLDQAPTCSDAAALFRRP